MAKRHHSGTAAKHSPCRSCTRESWSPRAAEKKRAEIASGSNRLDTSETGLEGDQLSPICKSCREHSYLCVLHRGCRFVFKPTYSQKQKKGSWSSGPSLAVASPATQNPGHEWSKLRLLSTSVNSSLCSQWKALLGTHSSAGQQLISSFDLCTANLYSFVLVPTLSFSLNSSASLHGVYFSPSPTPANCQTALSSPTSFAGLNELVPSGLLQDDQILIPPLTLLRLEV